MLENLNQEQLTAVKTTDGPLLVLSGAGTGKTRVLTTRVAYILNQGLCKPWQILALTFTNKAANEMKNRLANLSDGILAMSGVGLFIRYACVFCVKMRHYVDCAVTLLSLAKMIRNL